MNVFLCGASIKVHIRGLFGCLKKIILETYEIALSIKTMTKLTDILGYLDTTLKTKEFKDASLNGLQVEGSEHVSKVCVSVDSGQTVIDEAVKRKAELLIVHHGIFWGNSLAVKGAHKKLLQTLLQANVSLYASHIPLDAHPDWGNNFQLAKLLELSDVIPAIPYNGSLIGCVGTNKKLYSLAQITEKLKTLSGAQEPVVCAFGPQTPHRIACMSGSGTDTMYRYVEDGFDTLISGEPKQAAYHFAKDNQLNIIYGGHYATETLGVKAIAVALEKKFGVVTEFIDHPTGI